MKENGLTGYGYRLAVAPMMEWTDRHCRYFHRQLTRQALLYSEMVVADAVIRGDRERLLGFDPEEHPVALQLGGSDPLKLAEAARIGEAFGYNEINLNVGCPSDRVQSGTFGACLMKTPTLVADCVAAMKSAVGVPVTVKCRIGVDDQDPESALDMLADDVLAAGTDALWVHARKAWLKGLSPKENRELPPLNYARVYRLKERLARPFIGINGGISTLAEARRHLASVDGVMLGRAAYHTPAILVQADALVSGAVPTMFDPQAVLEKMTGYVSRHIERGGRLCNVSRHMVGLFHGLPGARRYRQILSVEATRPDASADVLRQAFGAVDIDSGREAA